MTKSPRTIFRPEGTWGDRDIETIHCPVCGSDFQHIQAIIPTPGKDNYKAVNKIWKGRGDLLTVQFECESGHIWELNIWQHKGQSLAYVKA